MATNQRDGREVYSQSTHTRAFVEFHSDQNPQGKSIWLTPDDRSDNYIGKLISVNTHKGFDGASGTFTIVAKKLPSFRRQDSVLRFWHDAEDVWTEISFIVDGQQFHVMTGLVDVVRETMTRIEGGKRVETLTITGRCTGKVLETTDLWVNAFSEQAPVSMVKYVDYYNQRAALNSTPDEWVKFFLEAWVGNNGLAEHQWLLPSSMGSKSFYDLLTLDNIEQMRSGNGKLRDATLWRVDTDRGFGKLWDSLVEYSNDFLNELWIDLAGEGQGKLKPAIFLRERPFPTRNSGRVKWDAIREHVLEKGDVYHREISKGGAANRYNYWSIRVNGRSATMSDAALAREGKVDGASLGKPGSIPIWNEESIAKHGLRRWEQSTLFLSAFVDEGDEIWPVLAANWLRRAHDWYVIAPMQLQGTIESTRLLPEIRMGQRLLEKRDEGDIEFYIESVDHAWSYPRSGHSTFTVTRGQYKGEDLLAMIYKQINTPKSPKLGDFVSDALSAVDSVMQVRKYEVLHGGDGFELDGAPDLADLEEVGKSLISEGASPFSSQGPKPDRTMIPEPDRENDQADRIADGDVNAKIQVPFGSDFGKEALERGDDPLAGFDDSQNNDPLFGIDDL